MLTLGDFKFVVATTPRLLDGVFRLRYKVYAEEFGFVQSGEYSEGKEVDEWDPYSIHMAALNPEGEVIGTIRLILNSEAGLPTLNIVAPFYQDKNPRSRHIGEVSRLAVARSFRRRVEDGFQGVKELASPKSSIVFHRQEEGEFPSQERRKRFAVVLGLFKIMYHVSKRIDLKDWYMISEKRLWYLLKRYHILFNAIGPEMDYHGVRIPYLGHIRDIESHMMKVSANLAESFQEGLASENVGTPVLSAAGGVPPPSPSADQPHQHELETFAPNPVSDAPLPTGDPQPVGGQTKVPTPYFVGGAPTSSAVEPPYSQEEAERNAVAAAEAVAEIVWPHRIPKRQ